MKDDKIKSDPVEIDGNARDPETKQFFSYLKVTVGQWY